MLFYSIKYSMFDNIQRRTDGKLWNVKFDSDNDKVLQFIFVRWARRVYLFKIHGCGCALLPQFKINRDLCQSPMTVISSINYFILSDYLFSITIGRVSWRCI